VTGAIAPLADVSLWARGSLLVIVPLILGAILFTRLAVWVRGRIMARIDAHASEADELVRAGGVRIPPGRHQRVSRSRHRTRDRRRGMSPRPRNSTVVLTGLFLAMLALYIVVRPVPAPAGSN
jgi:hypothetical protein